MKLDPTVAAAIVALIASVASVVLTNRYAARSARKAHESAQAELAAKVDVEAFQRARDSYDAAIAEQERRIERLNREIEDNHQEYLSESKECMRRIRGLQADVKALGEWARPLLRAARAAGIQHPDPPVWFGNDLDG